MARPVLLAVSFAALACSVSLAGAAAKVECKGTVTSPPILSTDDVDSSWQTTVTNTYGPGWADLGKAQNKRYYDTNLGLAILHYMTAQPCRNVVVINPNLLNGNKLLQKAP